MNLLAGKEWQVGKNNNNLFSINGRFTFQGGDHYTPLLYDESASAGELKYDYTHAYEAQEDPATVLSVSISYRRNKPGHSSIWTFHLLNALAYEEYRDYEFNLKTGLPEMQYDRIIVPNISYKIEF